MEVQKDLRIEAQQRDFQDQLIAEQAALHQVTGTLEELHQELEAIKNEHNTQNPMDVSSSTDTVSALNHVKQQVEQENMPSRKNWQKQKLNMNKPYKTKIAK